MISLRGDFSQLDTVGGAGSTQSDFSGHHIITVPDADLLFLGELVRDKHDLVLFDAAHRFTIPNYFSADRKPVLVSPQGAQLDPKFIDAVTGHLQYAQATDPDHGGAKLVGHVVKATGSATIVRNGVAVIVNQGDNVYQSDVLQTGSDSTLGLVLNDGTALNLSANARLLLNDLTYDDGTNLAQASHGAANSALITLVQGAASFVAGQVAKTGNMQVATPVATMGIRGTAVILDIDSNSGQVTISVVDQHDNKVHQVEVYNNSGVLIGTVASTGNSLIVTPTANFDVIAQEINKTPAQVQLEFNVFQQVISTYNSAKVLFPDLPQPSDPTDVNPKSIRFAGGSPPPGPAFGDGSSQAVLTTALDQTPGGPLVQTFFDTGSKAIFGSGSSSVQTLAVLVTQGDKATTGLSLVPSVSVTNQTAQTISGVVSGAFVQGSTVSIFDNGGPTPIATAIVGADGAFSTVVHLVGDGPHNLVARYSLGTATLTTATTILLDTTAPTVSIAPAPDHIVSLSQTITGKLIDNESVAGSQVTIFEDGSPIAVAKVNNDGTWSAVLTLHPGTNVITASASDVAGNVGNSSPVTITVNADVTAHLVHDTGSSPSDGITSDDRLIGTGLANATVTLSENGQTWQTTAGDDGRWTFTPGALSQGLHHLVVSETIAGTVAQATVDFTFDSQPPAVSLDNTGGVTNHLSQSISGKVTSQAGSAVVAGTSVTVFDNGVSLGTATVHGDGTWSLGSTALHPGANVITASETDLAGNVGSSPSVTITVTADFTAQLARDTGPSASDGITADDRLNGTGFANAIVTFTENGHTWQTTAGDDGSWSFTPPDLSQGFHHFVVSETIAGTLEQTSVDFTYDSLSPSVVIDNTGGVTDQQSQTISGKVTSLAGSKAVAGATVVVLDNGLQLGTATVHDDGTWSLGSKTLLSGSNEITASVTDLAGNVGNSSPVTITVSAAFAARLAHDTGSSPIDGITSIDTLTGSGLANATVTFTEGKQSWQITADGDGKWSFTPSDLSQGSHHIDVSETIAGTLELATVDFTLDSQPPSVTIDNTDEVTSQQSQTISGKVMSQAGTTVVSGATVTVFDNGVSIGTAVVNDDGTWSLGSTTLAPGPNLIQASVTDLAGNQGDSSKVTITVNVTFTAQLTDDTGISAGDHITSNDGLSGTGLANAVVTFTENEHSWQTTAGADGTWSFTPSDLSEGPHHITVSETIGETIQNVEVDFTFDSQPPLLTIDNEGGATTQQAQTISGKATSEAGGAVLKGTTVAVFDNGKSLGTASVNDDGTWSLSKSLNPGSHNITASVTDLAGNVGDSSPVTITVAGPPVITAPSSAIVNLNHATLISGISLSEVDSLSGETFTVSLSATNGKLAASGAGGSSVSSSGNTLTISGTLDQVNAALATLSDTDRIAGSDTIRLSASDSLGSHTSQDVTIAVTAAGLSGATSGSADEGTILRLSVVDTFPGTATITGLPHDLSNFSGGQYDRTHGTWTGSAAELNALAFTTGEDGRYSLTISAGGIAQAYTLTVNPFAPPILGGATSATFSAGEKVTLGVTDSPPDDDERLGNVTISQLPHDLTHFSGGIYDAESGKWVGTASQFNNLSFTAGEAGIYSLLISATTLGDEGGTISENYNLTVNSVENGPITWKNDVSLDWATPGAWKPSGVPTSSDDVVINASGKTYTVTVANENAFAHSLAMDYSTAAIQITDKGSLALGGNLTISSGGLLIGSGGALKDFATHASYSVHGTLTDDGILEVAGGTLEISGSVSGRGSLQVDDQSVLQIDNSASPNVNFATGSGLLVLNDPTHFSGSIARLGGSLAKGDVIDVFGFDAKATVKYEGTTSGGTVTISEENHSTVILHVGANSTHWSDPVLDNSGKGILIHDPPEPITLSSSAPGEASFSEPPGAPPPAEDAFVFKPLLPGPAIPDADLQHGTFEVDHTLFQTVMSILASAEASASRADTLIFDALDEFKHLPRAELKSHANDFHIV